MKLVTFKHRWDWGHDYYLTILQTDRWCFFQSCFYTAVYGRTFPYLNITLGSGRLFYFAFSFLRFGFSIEFIARSWYV